MSTTLFKKETRTDYAGTYTAYIYSDGHIETDPPHRPTSKEDAQRQRRVDAMKKRAIAILASERAAKGLSTLPVNVKRENLDTVAGKVLLSNYHDVLHKISEIAPTSTAADGSIQTLRTQVGLGGKVVGKRAGERVPYDLNDVPHTKDKESGVRSPSNNTRI